jgi:hypothetical protein
MQIRPTAGIQGGFSGVVCMHISRERNYKLKYGVERRAYCTYVRQARGRGNAVISVQDIREKYLHPGESANRLTL